MAGQCGAGFAALHKPLMAERDTGAAAAVGIADELTVNNGKGKGRLKNENSHRTTESTSGHWPFSGLRPRAGVCVFACRRTAVDPAATRRLRTRCDATLQSVRPGRSACLSLHVPLPTLPQPRLPRRILRRPEKEAEAPLRSPTTGIAGCCARAWSEYAAAPPISVMNSRRLMSDTASLRSRSAAPSVYHYRADRSLGLV